jgi:thiol:disulfide interchange protein/DsbC/DsbD-like thiol-disulfide interchange protein
MQSTFARTLLLLSSLFAGLAAVASEAGDVSTSPFPPPPKVDLSAVAEASTARPPGQNSKPHPVVARLISEHAVVTAGSKVQVGLHLEQERDWHTYWKSPGDVGQPTMITWTLPPGVTAADQVFPVPLRFSQSEMISYGYDGQVLHIVELALADDLPKGKHTLTAEVSWLVCKTSCIPGEGKLSLDLEVGAEAKRSAYAPLFSAYRERWPTPTDRLAGIAVKGSVSVDAVVPNSDFKVVLHVTPEPGRALTTPGPELWPTFTPIVGMDWMVTATRLLPVDGGFVVLIEGSTFEPQALPTDDEVGGLLQVEVDGTWVRTEVAVPLRWAAAGAAVKASTDPVWQLVEQAEKTPTATAPTEPAHEEPAPPIEPLPVEPTASASIWGAGGLMGNLGLGFLGGLILNIMPCVLPVLLLKLYSLVEQGAISDAERRTAGLAYTGGILASFWLLALAVVGMRMVGTDVGWGFQMQEPGYVAALATLVFLFSLSLFGVFEIPAFGATSAHELGEREGIGGYFFTGVFATLVATPCSAPILGVATVFAFSAPTPVLFLVFTAIGLGLASPFLVVAFVPAAYRLLPAPGAWMESFKHLLGFTLVATSLWLVGVLMSLIGADRSFWFLAFLTTVALAAWIFGHFAGVAAEGRRQVQALLVAVGVMMLGGWRFLDLQMDTEPACDSGELAASLDYTEEIPWQNFSDERVDALVGKTVFIDFTADWCVSCKANEQAILETEVVRSEMARRGVVALKADWTRRDERITAWLKRYDRVGVPMYLVIPPSGVAGAFTLPEVITTGMVVEALEKASEG